MKAVVTRVKSASVTIEGKVEGAIGQGYLVLLGVGPEDTEAEAGYLAEKIVHLRVFEDEQGKMNLNLEQVGIGNAFSVGFKYDSPEVRDYVRACLEFYMDLGFDFFFALLVINLA